MASRLQDVIGRGPSAARPLATAVAPGTLYYSTDTATTDRSDGSIWETYADSSGGAAAASISKLAAPYFPEIDIDSLYESPIPGPPGPQGLIGLTGAAGPPGSGGAGGGGIASSIPFFAEPEEILFEPAIPYPGPAGPPGAAGSLTSAQKTRQIGITIDGAGAVLTTGLKGFKSFPVAGTITAVRLLADQSGSIVIDVWKDTYANYPPTVADTITASAKPTISTADKSEDVTLTGWTTSISAGDIFGFNIDSVTSITRVTLELTIVVT